MLPGERRNPPSNPLEQYSNMKMDEMIAQREYLRSPEGEAFVKQVGIEWAIQQSKDLLAYGVPCIHYYTMGKSLANACEPCA